MNFAEKLQDFFGLNDGDEQEVSYDETISVEQNEATYSSPNRSNFTREDNVRQSGIKETYSQRSQQQQAAAVKVKVEETENRYYERPHYQTRQTQENVKVPNKVVQLNKRENTFQRETMGESKVKKISILEPRTYTESKNIAKSIFRNEIVIVNFHLVEESQARRIVDFLTGAVYALDGDIQRLGNEIFICTPPNTEIDSATAQSLIKDQFRDF